MSCSSLEGRLNAHRKLLIALVTLVGETPSGRSALQRLKTEQLVHCDHEEDPGVEPDALFAIQRLAGQEVTTIINAGLARIGTEDGAL